MKYLKSLFKKKENPLHNIIKNYKSNGLKKLVDNQPIDKFFEDLEHLSDNEISKIEKLLSKENIRKTKNGQYEVVKNDPSKLKDSSFFHIDNKENNLFLDIFKYPDDYYKIIVEIDKIKYFYIVDQLSELLKFLNYLLKKL